MEDSVGQRVDDFLSKNFNKVSRMMGLDDKDGGYDDIERFTLYDGTSVVSRSDNPESR